LDVVHACISGAAKENPEYVIPNKAPYQT
jgi:hypothetical protein